MTIKVYELYPCLGSFLVKTVDYHRTAYLVAATSVRQAYAVAYKRVWIDPHATHPVGIMAIYNTKTGAELWCGCSHLLIERRRRHKQASAVTTEDNDALISAAILAVRSR